MKSIGPETPYGYTIFCDDIRREIGNKISFVGIYIGSINLHKSLPFQFPKFGFAITYCERSGESTEPVTLRIFLPGEDEENPFIKSELPVEQLRNQEPPQDKDTKDPILTCNIQIVAQPMIIKANGLIKVRAYRGDLEIRLGTILVKCEEPLEQALLAS